MSIVFKIRKYENNDSDHIKAKKYKREEEDIWDILNDEDKNNIIWVSPSSIKNYMMKDSLLDWIILKETNGNFFNKHVQLSVYHHEKNEMEKVVDLGIKFENYVFNYLMKKYGDDVVKLDDTSFMCNESCERTMDLIKKEIPIIIHGQVRNKINKSHGIPDIIIRSDWINKLFKVVQLQDNESKIKAPLLKGNYHYRIIDIKYTTLIFTDDGMHLMNNDLFPAHKAQLAIYTAALGQIQQYIPDKAYILSRAWKYTDNTHYHGKNQFRLLGHVNFRTEDNHYIDITKKAMDWIKYIKLNWMHLSCFPPSIPELYPNMNNKYDYPYHDTKLQIYKKIKETENGDRIHKDNMFSWNKIRDFQQEKYLYKYEKAITKSSKRNMKRKYS